MRCISRMLAPIVLLAGCHHPAPVPPPAPVAVLDPATPPAAPPASQVVVTGPPDEGGWGGDATAAASVEVAPAPEAAPTPDPAPTEGPATTVEETVISDPPFRADLAPYGAWMVQPGYGWVWVPRSMPPDWRPYTYGHWVWVDECGWTWVADEPWGSVAFHYGRWYFDASIGWAWVPGTIWGPSWVVWRHGGGFVGWAPLPPTVEVGFVCSHPAWVDVNVRPTTWVFVAQPMFCAPTLRGHVVVATRNAEIVHATRNVTNASVVRGRLVDRSLDVRVVERFASTPVPRARFVRERNRSTLVERRGSQESRHVFAMPAPQQPRSPPPRQQQKEQQQPQQPPKHDGKKKGGGGND